MKCILKKAVNELGVYYGVRKVQEIGRRLSSYDSTPPQVRPNERIIAIIGNGLFKIAPDVTDPMEYAEFFGSYSRGNWLTFRPYVLTVEQLALCPDEGRVNDDD